MSAFCSFCCVGVCVLFVAFCVLRSASWVSAFCVAFCVLCVLRWVSAFWGVCVLRAFCACGPRRWIKKDSVERHLSATQAGGSLVFTPSAPGFVELIQSPTVSYCVTVFTVIRSFQHKGLRQLFEAGTSAKVNHDQQARIVRLLDVLESSAAPGDMNLPGFHFHRLRGRPVRYSVRVTGNWRLTFGWKDSNAIDVDLEDYH